MSKKTRLSLKSKIKRTIVAAAVCAASSVSFAADLPEIVSETGDITMPSGFRQWVAMGAWVVLPEKMTDEKPGADGVHMVYAQVGDVEAFRDTGNWRDGTVIVKELFDASTGPMTTGKVSRVNNVGGYFVMVKD